MKSVQRPRHINSSPDMTPMLDIVFILIIFFVLTTTFAVDLGIEPTRPITNPRVHTSKEPVLLFELGSEANVTRNGVPTDIWSAEAMMKQFRTEYADKPVILKLLDGSKLKLVVRMYDAAHKAGYKSQEIIVL